MIALQIKSNDVPGSMYSMDFPNFEIMCRHVVKLGISAQDTILIELPHPIGVIEAVGGELYDELRYDIITQLKIDGNWVRGFNSPKLTVTDICLPKLKLVE